MAQFIYKAISKDNKIVEGKVSAFSKKGAEKKISRDGVTALLVFPENPPLTSALFGFSNMQRILFFRNLSTMISAQLSIFDALGILEEQAGRSSVRKAVHAMRADVENGQKLSQAMKRFPHYFSSFLAEAVAIGEVSGKLNSTLDRISNELERDYDLVRRVRGAMLYPTIIITVVVLVSTGLIIFVLPRLAELFAQLNAQLPIQTRLLLGLGTFVQANLLAIGAIILSIFVGIFIVRRYKKSRYVLHMVILHLPLFGTIVKEFNIVRFFRELESLYGSGVSLLQSVNIAKMVVQNEVYRKAIEATGPLISHGISFGESLKSSPFLFPIQTQRMIEVGEKTGKLDEVFRLTTSYHERSLRHKINTLPSIIEPILIVGLGFLVGGLALSIFLPIYQVVNAF